MIREDEVVVTIKASESELEHIIWALTMLKTSRIPVDPEWKKPYKVLLKDMLRIQEGLKEAKRDRINDQKKENTGEKLQEDIEKAQGITPGCKDGLCE